MIKISINLSMERILRFEEYPDLENQLWRMDADLSEGYDVITDVKLEHLIDLMKEMKPFGEDDHVEIRLEVRK
jgi:hypothetical protein